MTPEIFIAQKAAEAIMNLYGVEASASTLQVQTTRKEFEGDFTLVVFPLLRMSHSTPENTGNAIGQWLKDNVPEISDFNVAKGFLNLLLSGLYWTELFRSISSDAGFGQLPATGRKVMVEFSSPNTNKPLHLGHVRNNLLGSSVSDLLKAAGEDVIKTTLVNDRGVHICKSMYAWQKAFDGATPESTGKKGDHLVGDCYVKFAQMEKKDPSVMDDVHEMLVKWEAADPEVRGLWKMMNGWVFDGFEQTYRALGISFDKAMEGLQLLRKYEIEYAILCTVNDYNSGHPEEVYRFLRQCGNYIQFLPVVEARPTGLETVKSQRFATPPGPESLTVSPNLCDFSVSAEAFGDFITRIYSVWKAEDSQKISVQLFDTIQRQLAGQPCSLCTMDMLCGHSVSLDFDGKVYSCDRYQFSEYLLGNILESPLSEILERNRNFGMYKTFSLPEECLHCEYVRLCAGGCPKDRLLHTFDGKLKNILCKGYKQIFRLILS